MADNVDYKLLDELTNRTSALIAVKHKLRALRQEIESQIFYIESFIDSELADQEKKDAIN